MEEQAIKDEQIWKKSQRDDSDGTERLDSLNDSFEVKNEPTLFKQELQDADDEEMCMEDLVGRDVTLPSNKDSKLWRLKVKTGYERQIVMRLTNKLIHSLNNGQPLMVL